MKPKDNNNFYGFRELLTEEELILFLRIPEVSKAKNYHFVVENLKRMRDLPRDIYAGNRFIPCRRFGIG